MEQPRQERELREWLDRLAIQDLINRYSDAVTRADWDQCEAVFAPNAVWESPVIRAAIREPCGVLGSLETNLVERPVDPDAAFVGDHAHRP
jgi:hypothetical protein